ncbi:MAG: translational GTPase TypA [Planctomycetota bacterium]
MSDQLRNIAIIAHVDHGKTTLVDRMIQAAGLIREGQALEDRILDSNDLERERGITILAKNISVQWHGCKINIIDTPGHSDFGGEVERVLNMADGCLLLVDAFEGPMPQTRFVLRKALERKLKPVVVINKIDRPDARPVEVLDEVFDLFCDLGASDDLLDFPVVYASGRDGYARREPADGNRTLEPLFEAIIKHVPAPHQDRSAPVQFQVTTLDHSDYVGRIAIGRVYRGELRSFSDLMLMRCDGSQRKVRIAELLTFEGMKREKCDHVFAGDICAVQGLEEVGIGDTLADLDHPEPMPIVRIDEPTISMIFRVNTSPFAGQDGEYVTSRHLRDRLMKEIRSNVALRVEETAEPDAYKVSGRGVLHLGILVENMRREGFEFAVGKPKVIFKEIDGKKAEPVEHLVVEVQHLAAGKVIELLGQRRGEVKRMEPAGEMVNLEFLVPSRGLIGLRTKVLNATCGEAIMHHNFYDYEFFKGSIPHRTNGVMVSMEGGSCVAYSLDSLADRGDFFVKPGDPVYEGLVVGEHCKPNDIVVNVCRMKKLTNIRAAGADKKIILAPPRQFSLEDALEYIEEDELVEVTPKAIRLRKRFLTEKERKRNQHEHEI